MSIAFPATDAGSTLERVRAERGKPLSAARIEANRRNSRRSTGPRTVAGKQRSSRNAMKHGLCRSLSCLPSECEATFYTFAGELEEELRPRTALQRLLFDQIASLTWRLQRLPEAQSKLFAEELAKVEPRRGDDPGGLMPSDVLARRFSDEPGRNGFALLERYERGMRSQLLRLMRQFEQLQKHRATTPYDPDEPPAPPERAWTPAKAQQQREWFAEQERLAGEGKQPNPQWVKLRAIHAEQLAAERSEPCTEAAELDPHPDSSERSQTNPPQNPDSEPATGTCGSPDDAPVTERTQGDREANDPRRRSAGVDRGAGGEGGFVKRSPPRVEGLCVNGSLPAASAGCAVLTFSRRPAR